MKSEQNLVKVEDEKAEDKKKQKQPDKDRKIGKRGYKFCKNPNCNELIFIHLKVCRYCGYVYKMKDKRKQKVKKNEKISALKILNEKKNKQKKITKKLINSLRVYFRNIILEDKQINKRKIECSGVVNDNLITKALKEVLIQNRHNSEYIKDIKVREEEVPFLSELDKFYDQIQVLDKNDDFLTKNEQNEEFAEFGGFKYNKENYSPIGRLKVPYPISSIAISSISPNSEFFIFMGIFKNDKFIKNGQLPNFHMDQKIRLLGKYPLVGKYCKNPSFGLFFKISDKGKFLIKSTFATSADIRFLKTFYFQLDNMNVENIAMGTVDGKLTILTYHEESLSNLKMIKSVLNFSSSISLKNPTDGNFTCCDWINESEILVGNETGHVFLLYYKKSEISIKKSWNSYKNFYINKISINHYEKFAESGQGILFAVSTLDAIIKIFSTLENDAIMEINNFSVKFLFNFLKENYKGLYLGYEQPRDNCA